MSNDAEYLFAYESFEEPCANTDKEWLESTHGGNCILVSDRNGCTIYWNKPKYRLIPEEIRNLSARQIFEREDCEPWKELNKMQQDCDDDNDWQLYTAY